VTYLLVPLPNEEKCPRPVVRGRERWTSRETSIRCVCPCGPPFDLERQPRSEAACGRLLAEADRSRQEDIPQPGVDSTGTWPAGEPGVRTVRKTPGHWLPDRGPRGTDRRIVPYPVWPSPSVDQSSTLKDEVGRQGDADPGAWAEV